MDVTNSEVYLQKNLSTNNLNVISRYSHCSSHPSTKISKNCCESYSKNEKIKRSCIDMDNKHLPNRKTSVTCMSLMDKRVLRSSENVENNPDSSLIPANIMHKYGTSVVEQLISPAQVKHALSEADEHMSYTRRYSIPTPNLNSWPIKNILYYELGHCLRANFFPGAPMQLQTLTQDSYTAEVNKKGRVDKHTAYNWYGRKTDDLAVWSQVLMGRAAMAKNLESVARPPQTVPLPPRPRAHPAPPVTRSPKTDKKKTRTKCKPKKTQVQSAPVTKPSEDDNDNEFWDFYDKPIL